MRCCGSQSSVLKLLAFLIVNLGLVSAGSAATFKVIHTFGSGANDGVLPEGSLIMDAAGNLYGTTVAGGSAADAAGTIYELSPNADGSFTETILYNFTNGADGGLPAAGLTFDSEGNLYGTAQQGGIFNQRCAGGCGTVFELSPSGNGWTFTVLHEFTGHDDGGLPSGPVVLDSQGNVYGTTAAGGVQNLCASGCGNAFELVRSQGWKEKVLHTFLNSLVDGSSPSGNVVLDSQGNLAGTTVNGGAGPGYSGTVFRLTPTQTGPWTETILHSFCSKPSYCGDGSGPEGGVVLSSGKLYGTTNDGGGPGAHGTVFELENTGTGIRLAEYSFTGSSGGANPVAPVLVRQNQIYGTTQQGGIVNGACILYPNGNGVVYQVGRQNGILAETVLYSFTGGSDGCGPSGGLVADSAGNLYGTVGSSVNGGVAFEITP